MGFRLPESARRYFETMGLERENRTEIHPAPLFDMYYFCVMAGFLTKTIGLPSELGDEFVQSYPETYENVRELIAGLLISTEIERRAINHQDQTAVENLMTELLELQSPTLLSKKGIDILNRYAASGIHLIQEKIPNTGDLATFLVHFYKLMQTSASELGTQTA